MSDLTGKVAVVTGGASGVGRSLCETFARQGMTVVMADIEQAALDAVAEQSRIDGLPVTALRCDVTDPDSVQALAQQVFSLFGNVHILCNNAGVGVTETSRPLWTQTPKDWQWVYQVNVMGVVHGIMAFLPHMLEQGEPGHVVNTSSGNGGLTPFSTTPLYASSKASVTALSEVLHAQLRSRNSLIKAHVLFPGPHLVNTNILNSQRNRPSSLRDENGAPEAYVSMQDLAEQAGLADGAVLLTEPHEVAEACLEGILDGQFWILPESEEQDERVRDRTESILNRRNPATVL